MGLPDVCSETLDRCFREPFLAPDLPAAGGFISEARRPRNQELGPLEAAIGQFKMDIILYLLL